MREQYFSQPELMSLVLSIQVTVRAFLAAEDTSPQSLPLPLSEDVEF